MIAWGGDGGVMRRSRRREGIINEQEKAFRGDGYIHYFDEVMASWVYTYIKTYHILYFKYVQFIIGQL